MGDLIGCFEVNMHDAGKQLGGLAEWIFNDQFERRAELVAELEMLQMEIDECEDAERASNITERMREIGKELSGKRC